MNIVKLEMTPHKGLGVFARCSIEEGVCVSINPVEFVPPLPEDHPMWSYTFWWHDDLPEVLAMGLIAYVNHSVTPNCRLERERKNLKLQLWTLRPIAEGEELTHCYHTVWFEEKLG